MQWNDFKENAIGSLGSLKDDRDFLDVTLASEDEKQIEAQAQSDLGDIISILPNPFEEEQIYTSIDIRESQKRSQKR